MLERRKHKRYRMPRGTFAILRNDVKRLHHHRQMNIGEIAMVLYKAEPEVMGQVVDISMGGIAFQGDPDRIAGNRSLALDLLMTEQGLYMHDIPYIPLESRHPPCGPGDRDTTHCPQALRFGDLGEQHRQVLNEVLTHHVG